MMSVFCRECGKESFAYDQITSCPLCGGSVDPIYASQPDEEQTRLNRIRSALHIVNRDESLAFEHRNHLIESGADKSAIHAASTRWQELVNLSLELQFLLDDEADLQQLLTNILQSVHSPESLLKSA